MTTRGLVVDLFAGGGGASTGLEAALERPVDVAVNHSAVAIAVHTANHPATRHLTTDVFEVDPLEATGGRPVDVLWASPDCTHFSVAKGGKPRKQGIRSLAEVVVQWASSVRPAVIFVENVREFLTWGPLDAEGYPIKARAGELFERWRVRLELLGYRVEWRVLDASEFGAPTKRKRLFVVARCDGQPIAWPTPTHGPGRLPLHTAAECIDWSIPCPSIFERKKPLAPKTLARVAAGIRRFVLESASPFIVKVNHGGEAHRTESADQPLSTVTASRRGHALMTPVVTKFQQNSIGARPDVPLDTVMAGAPRFGVVAPTLVQTGYGERKGQRARFLDLHEPLGVVVAGGAKHALVSAFLAKHYGGVVGTGLHSPVSTVTATDHHSLVTATLGCGADHRDEVSALVMIEGVEHVIVDIGLRMLEPHELLRAQFGRFAEGYDLSAAQSKSDKVRLIGNSVAPECAEAVVRANVPARQRRVAA